MLRGRIAQAKRAWLVLTPVALCAAGMTWLLIWAFSSGFAADFERAVLSDINPFDDDLAGLGASSGGEPGGTASLEEIIVGSDVIARARFLSVNRASIGIVAKAGDWIDSDVSYYRPAMEYRFAVFEYLKGSGPSEIVAVVSEEYEGERFATAQGARLLGTNLVAERDTTWDSREAIVFLGDSSPTVPSLAAADRYSLGGADGHAIDSPHQKRWLPAAASDEDAAARTINPGEQKFLLDAPTGYSSSAATRSVPTMITDAPTITLAGLKQKIADLQAEVDAGDGTEEYRKCVYWKYAWTSFIEYKKQKNGGAYPRYRDDAEIASGAPEGTEVAQDSHAPFTISELGPTEPEDSPEGTYVLFGEDVERFDYRYPGVVYVARPLPQGEYKVFWGGVPIDFIPCDGWPDESKERDELVVTVTAPAGTLHESFFDPVALSGGGVGATGSSGVIDPEEFIVGSDDVEIDGLEWRSGSVVLELDDYVSLSGQTLDFIELDGSIDTSLDVAAATVNQTAATWTWSVTDQPWVDGGSADGADSGDGHGAHCRDTHADAGANRDTDTHADAGANSGSRQREPLSRRCDRNRFSAACTSTCPP